jgi:hypothetical protein
VFVQSEKFVHYPVSGQELSGDLPRRNASLTEAQNSLTISKIEFSLHTRGKRSFWAIGATARHSDASFYLKRFGRGQRDSSTSILVCRDHQFDVRVYPSLPPVQTAKRALQHSKKARQGLAIKGNVETEFLYSTLLPG